MKGYRGQRGKFVLIVLILFAVIVICGYINISPEESLSALWQTVFLSIACSIVASGLFYLMQSAVDRDNNEEVELKLNEIDKKLRQLENLYDSGVVSIRSKTYYDKNGEFWKQMIKSTTNQLDLVGHDISPWFSSEYRTVFIGKVKSMIKNKKDVRIILSGDAPDMKKIHAVERGDKDENELSKIEVTCFELRQIIKEIRKNKRKHQIGNLDVYIADLKQVSYMYIRTDSRCFMSPYVSSGNSFLLEMEAGFEYSRWLDMDFENMLKFVKEINLEMNNERTTKSGCRKFLFGK